MLEYLKYLHMLKYSRLYSFVYCVLIKYIQLYGDESSTDSIN